MTKLNKKDTMSQIYDLRKELLYMRVKKSSGDNILIKDYRAKKKEIARLLTTVNSKANKNEWKSN
jgi:ribosomal protein L29